MAEEAKNENKLMVKETTPKKVAFMNKPYSQEERIKKDEEELEQLLKEQKGEVMMISQNQTVLQELLGLHV